MDPETPLWLNKKFLKIALENGKDYMVTIEDMTVNMPVEKGNNYSSDVLSVKVKYRKSSYSNEIHNISLIVKAPVIGKTYGSLEQYGHMHREVLVYQEFIPKLNKIFYDNIQGDNDNEYYLLPKSYFSSEKFVLLLEDLNMKDYKLADRLKQLDFDHCVLALQALAKFHAGSVLVHEKEKEFIEKTVGCEIVWTNKSEFSLKIREFMICSFRLLAELLKKRAELKKYSRWFQENSENVWDILLDSVKVNEKELNVLNHGDFWTSNMLFKYDENKKPIKVKLLDFQMVRYTSPAIDFLFFIHSSVQEIVKNEKLDELIKVYLNELNSTLERHGNANRLEECEFKKLLKDRSKFRIHVAIIVLPFVIGDLKAAMSFEKKEMTIDDWSDSNKNPIRFFYQNERYLKEISKHLEELEVMGIVKANYE